jgi:hypothetical protein
VVWLTQTASGWFLKSLAREGRMVIAATEADQEFNETRFPHLLAAVTQRDPQLLDVTADGRVSLAELFVAVSQAAAEQFENQNLAPTEHAQLDDDGDGRGTEAARVAEVLASPTGEPSPDLPRALRPDGAAAGKLILPWEFKPESKHTSG